jgi:hypothetical protein
MRGVFFTLINAADKTDDVSPHSAFRFNYLIVMDEKVGGITVDVDCTRLTQH